MSSERYTVRPAGMADIPQILSVFQTCFSPTYVSHSEVWEGRATADGRPTEGAADLLAAELPRRMAAFPEGVLVAEREGQVIGFAVARIEQGAAVSYGLCDDLCVAPTFWRRGVGALLLENVFQALQTRGIQTLFAESGFGNTQAHALLERAGFHPFSKVFLKQL